MAKDRDGKGYHGGEIQEDLNIRGTLAYSNTEGVADHDVPWGKKSKNHMSALCGEVHRAEKNMER